MQAWSLADGTGLLRALEERGGQVRKEASMSDRVVDFEQPDVLVLASHESGVESDEAVHRLRRRGLVNGIAVMTQRMTEAFEEQSLRAGADLVVSAEADPRSVTYRLEALARRVRLSWAGRDRNFASDHGIDVATRSVRVGIAVAHLSTTDFRILLYLLDNEQRWVSESSILRDVFDTCHAPGASIVRVHICSLRKALGPLGWRIRNRRSVGYRLVTAV